MAVEAAAGALLSALLDPLIGRLASPEVCKFFGVNSQSVVAELVEKLNVTLLSANALLNDAEDKQVNNPNIKTWVDMLNELLSEADDIVDEINTEALLRGDVKGNSFLRRLVPAPFNMAFDRAIKPKIENIVARLNHLLDQKGRLGLREGVRSKRLIERSPGPLIGDSSGVYGWNRDKEAVVELLFSENSTSDDIGGGDKVSVIPIVGMGGVGKTTLARLVYNDQKVKNHFKHRAWVTVSDDFDVFRLAKLVFERLADKESEAKEVEKLGDEMKAFLRGKKFLLVLDDVWNEKYNLWNAFKSYLTCGADGSKIIVTTRNESIGSKMGSVPYHRLNEMSEKDCWQLFIKHAFHNIEPNVCRGLEGIGRAIVKKCRGLPLAVMSLAGLLCSESDPKEWEAVLTSDVWDLHEKGNDEIIPSLWLSYSYLPSHLKSCFAYCSIFPKDYEYDKKKIILLWMAEGLLPGENMEDVGEAYFKTLISRSLFQRSTKIESIVVMHDLVHDLATFVSGRGFCVRLGVEHSLSSLTIKTRHLLYQNSFPEMGKFKGLSEAKCLRTLMPWGLVQSDDNPVNSEVVVKKFRCLRVLCLPSCKTKKVTESIGKLKHLRYLDLPDTRIKRLPDAVCSLYNLQTLLVSGCEQLTELPAKMGNLVSLRYLDLSCTKINRLPDSVCSLYNLHTLLLNGCTELTELPANMGRLLNLRHLDLSKTYSLKRMPLSNWNLKGLRTLTKLVLNDEHSGSKIKELKELSHGSFEIEGLENVVNPKDVLEAEFEKKSGITEIILEWSSSRSNFEKDREVLDALKPHVSLKKLNIKGYGGKELSDWVGDGSFSNLTEVSLFHCTSCCQLPPFQWLRSLKELTIEGCLIDKFPEKGLLPTTLQILKISNAQNLKFLDRKAFQHHSSLRNLWIEDCPKLECLPEQGLPASLTWLSVYRCPQLEARLQRVTGQDWHNISHILRITVDDKEI